MCVLNNSHPSHKALTDIVHGWWPKTISEENAENSINEK